MKDEIREAIRALPDNRIWHMLLLDPDATQLVRIIRTLREGAALSLAYMHDEDERLIGAVE